MEVKYKGKQVRISEDSHEFLVSLTPKYNMGAWVDEAIKEKRERDFGVEEKPAWPIKKETKST